MVKSRDGKGFTRDRQETCDCVQGVFEASLQCCIAHHILRAKISSLFLNVVLGRSCLHIPKDVKLGMCKNFNQRKPFVSTLILITVLL